MQIRSWKELQASGEVWQSFRKETFRSLVLSLLSLIGSPLLAGSSSDIPYLVRDIANGLPRPDSSSIVRIDGVVQGRALFWTYPPNQTPGEPYVYWSTDGTPTGTQPISDLLGGDSGTSNVSSTLCHDSSRSLIWTKARDGDGELLWKTDGTGSGTVLVAELPAGTWGSSSYDQLRLRECSERTLNGKVVFFTLRWNYLQGPTYELWETDGTFEGSRRVVAMGQDFENGLGGILDFVNLGNSILFSLQTAPDGFRLWRTDGTQAGTEPFLSQLEGTPILLARGFVRLGDVAFFVGFNSGSEVPLAVTDGTEPGSKVFPGLFPVPGTEDRQLDAVALADRLLIPASFNGSLQLHSVVPSEDQSTPLTAIDEIYGLAPLTRALVGGRALFVATLPSSEPHYTRDVLVSSDGSSAGTSQLSSSCGAAEVCYIQLAGVLGGEAYFFRSTNTGTGLWKTDGTEAGSSMVVSSICAESCGPTPLGTSGDRFYFLVNDWPIPSSLWVSNGTASGTQELVGPGVLDLSRIEFDGHANLGGSRLLFPAGDAGGLEPWITDGTVAGTGRLADLGSWIDEAKPQRLSASGTKVLFGAEDSALGAEPWASAGSSESTVLVADFVPGIGSSDPTPFASAGDLWPVSAGDPSSGNPYSLIVTDGTPGSFEPTTTLASPSSLSVPFGSFSLISTGSTLLRFDDEPPFVTELMSIGGEFDLSFFLAAGESRVYFRNHQSDGLHDLWSTDGSVEGTVSFCEAPAYQSYIPSQWIGELGNGVVFKATAAATGTEPYYCTQGASAVLLLDIAGGSSGSDPSGFIAVGGFSLFAATDSDGDRELWRTDGTPGGTHRLMDISSSASSSPESFVGLGEAVLFSADDGIHGRELWISDGTAKNTRMLADLAPGPMSSRPRDFELVGGAFVFSAESLAAGRELWSTSGTTESTRMVADIRPGPLSSRPEELTNASGRVFFRAMDELGKELWAVCPSWVADAEVVSSNFVEGDGGGAQVAVTLLREPACGDAAFVLETVDAGAIAGVDYVAVQESVALHTVGTSVLIAVPMLDDDEPESGEGIGIVLRDSLGRVRATATLWIVDDDGGLDADGDGVAGVVEDDAPNAGDGNGDGAPDSLQPGVASCDLSTGGQVTLEITSGCARLVAVQFHEESSYSGIPGLVFPFGLTSYVIPDCQAARLRLLLHGMSEQDCGAGHLKKTLVADPNSAGDTDWIDAAGAQIEHVYIGGGAACASTFDVIDGALGDLSATAGRIEDPVGLGIGDVSEIPTLGRSGVILLVGLIAALGLAAIRGARIRT